MPAYCHPLAHRAFRQALQSLESTSGLFRAAFAIAQHELPEAEVSRAEAVIVELAATVRRRVHSSRFEAKLAHLHDVLFDIVGFEGNVDDYYNPANSYLPEVLRTHRGLPITLALVYKCVGEQLGLRIEGINSPGHFLAAVHPESLAASSTGDGLMFVDPFFGGALLSRHDVYRRIESTTGHAPKAGINWLAATTHQQWLSRMLTNLQAVFARSGRERDLYAMQELQALLQ
ncbi:MAG TPA: transglutaminase-like domain-containing protein [Lacipirellulaceae bacterium]|jgi:regulator of sirC expression with transglutaminase-like and TPR domain|nr:transglutaminase-like domain-containing protein [Lacipirellulaceae bacterium]